MLRLVKVKIQSNKTITINNPIQLRQGDVNVAKLIIDPSLYISDFTNVLGFISFKRPDNKQTGQLLLKKEEGNLYSYVIKDPWLVDVSGELWFTLSFDKILKVENGTPVIDERVYMGNASLYINPDANYTIGDYLPPNDAEEILSQLSDIDNRVIVLEENIDNKLDKDFTTYPKLDWDTVENTDLVVLNKVDSEGNVTQYSAEAKDLYNSVNNIFPDDEGNIELNASDIPYDTTNVGDKLNRLEEGKINISEDVVYYSEISETDDPYIEVERAEYANRDSAGNIIVDTYSTKTELSNSINNLNTSIKEYVDEQDAKKQDTLTAGTGISLSASSLISKITAEQIYSGGLNDITESYTLSTASFTPNFLLVTYNDYTIFGGEIISLNDSIRKSNVTLDNWDFGNDNDNYQQTYHNIAIDINYNNKTISGQSKINQMTINLTNGAITEVTNSISNVIVKVYAIII